ncbi:MAG: hypothetical protein KKE76_09660 [Gammaproteobacteria bacterium]|nr:hypothetical protein [Gammaproteobacteria bacterium]
MPTLDSINGLLDDAAKTLDKAAREIRDTPLEPSKEHILRIGQALSNVFEIQHKIYELRPDLKPAYLDEKSKNPEGNRALGEAIVKADALADAGKHADAIKVLKNFINSCPDSELTSIAKREIERHKGAST